MSIAFAIKVEQENERDCSSGPAMVPSHEETLRDDGLAMKAIKMVILEDEKDVFT